MSSESKNRLNNMSEYIDSKGYASVSELCDEFGISQATVRRDLIDLENQKKVKRLRGGALSTQGFPEIYPISGRGSYYIEEKNAIAHEALSFVHDGATIFLDSSTTCLAFARAIREVNPHITVVTNYFAIAQELMPAENVETLFIGGIVNKRYDSTDGELTEQMVRQVSFQLGFIGFDGTNQNQEITNNRLGAIKLKQIIIENSEKAIGLADHSKFETSALLPICPMSSLAAIITDSNVEADTLERYKSCGAEIILAGKLEFEHRMEP